MGHHAPKYTQDQMISKNLPESLRRKMELFQAKNGLPVFLKGGPFDRVLFGTTIVLCGVGLLSCGKLVYDLGFRKKE